MVHYLLTKWYTFGIMVVHFIGCNPLKLPEVAMLKDGNKRVQVTLDPVAQELLDYCCRVLDASKSEVIRKALLDFAKGVIASQQVDIL